jgi:hypothetical protein
MTGHASGPAEITTCSPCFVPKGRYHVGQCQWSREYYEQISHYCKFRGTKAYPRGVEREVVTIEATRTSVEMRNARIACHRITEVHERIGQDLVERLNNLKAECQREYYSSCG